MSVIPSRAEAAIHPVRRGRLRLTAAFAVLLMGGLGCENIASDRVRSIRLDSAPARWPTATRLRVSRNRSTIVMFVHTQSPCARSSLSELERLLDAGGASVATHIVFRRSDASSIGGDASDLWQRALGIGGVHPHWDEDGREGALFGARFSGEVLVYDRSGKLRFSGDVESSRRYVGGDDRIVASSGSNVSNALQPSVLGCKIQ